MKLIRVLAVALLVSCGGHSANDVGPSSGLPRTATVGSLTPAQAGLLCDWTNAKQGGYGRVVNCPDGSQQTSDPDAATCVQSAGDFATYCPTVLVADVEDCANATGTDLCAFTTAAACANLRACFGV